ncbi:hypothetical protein D3C77_482040 [compost metagenome]
MSRIITGNLVVEDEKVSIQGEDGSITELTKENVIKIECRNADRFIRVTLKQITHNYEQYGWSIYAGIYSIVEIRR